MDLTTTSKGGGAGRGRLLIALALALLIAGATIILLVYVLPCGGTEAPGGRDGGGGPGEVADAAASPVPDAAAPSDLGPDRAPRPHGTRRITDRELRAMLRRQRGLIDACFRLAARDPDLTPSRISVSVELGDAGRVRSVAVDAGGARRLGGCLRRAVRGWRFSSGLRAQQISFPIIRPR